MTAPLTALITLAVGQLVFPEPPAHPTVDELRPLLGHPAGSDPVAGLLGPCATVDGESGPYRWHRYPGAGVTARVEVTTGAIVELTLHGAKTHETGRYEVALPEGLAFGHDQAQVLERLGPPTLKNGKQRRWEYWPRGLDVVFRRGGRTLESVQLRAALAPGSVEARVSRARLIDNPAGAATALAIELALRAAPLPDGTTLSLHLGLQTADGQAVQCTSGILDLRGPEGQLQAVVAVDTERPQLRVSERRIPLRALNLPPGEHTLTPTLTATLRTTDGPGLEPGTVVTPGLAPLTLTMPRVRFVRFRVREALLKDRVYDRNNPLPGFHPPDPAWLVTDRAVLGRATYYTSPTLADTRRPRWSARTPWLPVADGESLRLVIVDRDASGDEELSSLAITPALLRDYAKAGRMKRGGDVLELLIDRVEVR